MRLLSCFFLKGPRNAGRTWAIRMILIEPESCVPRAALPKRELARFLAQACERVGIDGEVTVLLTTNEQMRALNRSFRRKDKPTDVLSFPPADASFAGEPATGGDLAISVEIAREQALSLSHPFAVEIRILVLHGLLHLAGMDHEQDTGTMRRKESRLRREFGLPAGLIQRTAAPLPSAQVRVNGSPALRTAGRQASANQAQAHQQVSVGAKLRAKQRSKPGPSGEPGVVRGARLLAEGAVAERTVQPVTATRSSKAKASAR